MSWKILGTAPIKFLSVGAITLIYTCGLIYMLLTRCCNGSTHSCLCNVACCYTLTDDYMSCVMSYPTCTLNHHLWVVSAANLQGLSKQSKLVAHSCSGDIARHSVLLERLFNFPGAIPVCYGFAIPVMWVHQLKSRCGLCSLQHSVNQRFKFEVKDIACNNHKHSQPNNEYHQDHLQKKPPSPAASPGKACRLYHTNFISTWTQI